MSEWMDDIRELERLRDETLITADEYDRQRNIIMENRDAISQSVGDSDVGVSAWARLGSALLDSLLTSLFAEPATDALTNHLNIFFLALNLYNYNYLA